MRFTFFSLTLCVLVAVPAISKELSIGEQIQKVDFVETEIKSRSKHIDDLIGLVKDVSLDMDLRIRAVKALGAIRANEAVDILIQNLTVIKPEVFSEKTFEIVSPCMPALIVIGKESSRRALKELSVESDKFRIELLLMIIEKVEGRKTAQFLISNAISLEKNQNTIGNLKRALISLQAEGDTIKKSK